MDADPAEHHHVDNNAENGGVPVERMAVPRPAPDIDPENLPDTIFGDPEWWYDQRGKRGKHYRYTGRAKRISGSAGEKIRAELAAAIYHLLVWAKEQQTTPGPVRERVRMAEPMTSPNEPMAVNPPAPALSSRAGTLVPGPSGLSD